MMPNRYLCDGIFNLHLIIMKDSDIVSPPGCKNYAAVTTSDQIYFTVLDVKKQQFRSMYRGFEPVYDTDMDENVQVPWKKMENQKKNSQSSLKFEQYSFAIE